jgi:hypothetical protein
LDAHQITLDRPYLPRVELAISALDLIGSDRLVGERALEPPIFALSQGLMGLYLAGSSTHFDRSRGQAMADQLTFGWSRCVLAHEA